MVWLFGSSPLKEYKRYRKAGLELNHKIIDACVDGKVLGKAVPMLGLGKKGLLVLDDEDELSVLMDFSLYEIRKGGKNLVMRYAEEIGGENEIERELLEAMTKAKTGLFKVRQILRDKSQIVLEDLIRQEEPTTLTDINFSKTLMNNVILFFRPIRLAHFTMTSGIAFVFPPELEQGLVRSWKKLERKSSAERYAWFFRKSKKQGFKTKYM